MPGRSGPCLGSYRLALAVRLIRSMKYQVFGTNGFVVNKVFLCILKAFNIAEAQNIFQLFSIGEHPT